MHAVRNASNRSQAVQTNGKSQLHLAQLPMSSAFKHYHPIATFSPVIVLRHLKADLHTGTKVAAVAKQAPSTELLDKWVNEDRVARLQYLEERALQALKKAVDNFTHPTFPCALIAGDVVILHLLHKLDYLKTGKVKVVFIDTFHLFPETHTFLKQVEELFAFKAHVYQAAGFANKEEYKKVHGSDLYLTDVEKYDWICKVEPFQRALKQAQADVMINGRRRDHGAERAFLQVWEAKTPINCNVLAYWEFQDVWDYLEQYKVPYHPLHDQGFPSVGDLHSTLPVPKPKWFEYGGERSGRFQGMTNPDGTPKSECGIHSSPINLKKP